MGTILSFPAPLAREASPAAGPAEARWLNALTIDVEDYSHVSGFEGVWNLDDRFQTSPPTMTRTTQNTRLFSVEFKIRLQKG